MDGPLFHVEIEALEVAASDIRASVANQDRLELDGVPGPPEVYGNPVLHRSMSDLCARWAEGLRILHADATAIGDLLSRAAEAYRATDQASAATLAIDPGKQVVDD